MPVVSWAELRSTRRLLPLRSLEREGALRARPNHDRTEQLQLQHRHQGGPTRALQEHQRVLLPLSAGERAGDRPLDHRQQRRPLLRGGGREGRRGALLREPYRLPHRERDLGEDVVSRGQSSPRRSRNGGQNTKRSPPAQTASAIGPKLQAVHVRAWLAPCCPELHEELAIQPHRNTVLWDSENQTIVWVDGDCQRNDKRIPSYQMPWSSYPWNLPNQWPDLTGAFPH